MTDSEQQQINSMMAEDDFVGLGKKVRELFKLPQSFCKVRGNCCKVATFKGTLSYEDIQALAESDDDDAPNAREFLTLFEPYTSYEEVMAIAPGFVARVEEKCSGDPGQVTYFHCRFLGDAGACLIHEDRPTGCRVFPFPHESTIYHPGCGFEAKGLDQLTKIQQITTFFDKRFEEMQTEIEAQQQQVEAMAATVLDKLDLNTDDQPTT